MDFYFSGNLVLEKPRKKIARAAPINSDIPIVFKG
jgi:hypothetical protein